MPGDVLDDHDGVVDENADREDQREEADAVQRVAHDARREQREHDGRGDDDGDDQRLAPANCDADENDDGYGGEPEMEQKLVGLLVGRLAVVPCHHDVEVGGNDAALELLQALGDAFGDDHGIGAGALGKRHRNSRDGHDAIVLLQHIGNA